MTTNPYDQFDTPASSNPYDQFDAPVQPRMAAPVVARPAAVPAQPNAPAKPAKKEYEGFDAPKAAIKGFPKSAVNLAKGAVEMVRHPINTADDAIDIAGGAVLNMLPQSVRQRLTDNDIRNLQKTEKAGALGQFLVDRYGTLNDIERTFAEDSAGFMADLSTVLAGGAGVARGVAGATRAGTKASQALNAAARVTNPMLPSGPVSYPSRVIQGAANVTRAAGQTQAGNVLGTVAKYTDPRTPINAMGRVAKHIATGPKTALVLAAAENPTAVARAQQRPTQIVPNSPPTPAQAAVNVGATKFAALEAGAADNFPSEFARGEAAQNAARLAHADHVAHTPAISESRVRQRGVDSARDYAASNRVMTTVTPHVWDLLHRPGIAGVIEDARDLAATRGTIFGTPPGAPMQWSGRDIHLIKTAIDERAHRRTADGSPAFTRSQVNAMRDVQREFLTWVEQPGNNPAYGVGRRNYQGHSRAIDRMRFGQELKDIMQKPLTEGHTAAQRADALAAALRDPIKGNANIKRATGNDYERYARDLLTPGEIRVFERVVEDMARAKRVDVQASKGGTHKQNINNAMSDYVLPESFRTPGVVNTLARLLTGHTDKRIANEVGNAMQTTRGAATMLKDARTKRIAVKNVGAAARKAASVGTRYPAMYNAMSSEERER